MRLWSGENHSLTVAARKSLLFWNRFLAVSRTSDPATGSLRNSIHHAILMGRRSFVLIVPSHKVQDGPRGGIVQGDGREHLRVVIAFLQP